MEGNAGAGSDNMGYNLARWDNDKFTNNSAHAVQQVGIVWLGIGYSLCYTRLQPLLHTVAAPVTHGGSPCYIGLQPSVS